MQKKGKKTLLLYSVHAKERNRNSVKAKKKEKRNSASEKTEIQSTGKKRKPARQTPIRRGKKPTPTVGVCEWWD